MKFHARKFGQFEVTLALPSSP